MGTLTVTNSVIMITIQNVYNTATQLQGYAADDVYDFEDIDVSETSMGVDGTLSAGKIYVPIPWSISLQANSPSNAVFDAWYAYQSTPNGDVAPASINITLNGLGFKWTLSNGFLKKYSPAPTAKKIAQPRKFMIEFNSISVAPA